MTIHDLNLYLGNAANFYVGMLDPLHSLIITLSIELDNLEYLLL